MLRSNWTRGSTRTYHWIVDFWSVAPILGLCCPFIWLWGLVKYLKVPPFSDWRSRASLVGLSVPILSVVLWCVMLLVVSGKGLHGPTRSENHLIAMAGFWLPLGGMLVGLAGRPRLILAIVPASIGTMFFWFATTLP